MALAFSNWGARPLRAFFLGATLPLTLAFSAQWLFAGAQTTATLNGDVAANRTFTLFEAVQTALRQNPSLLTALQEIERTKGLVIEVRAEALPRLEANTFFQRTDPNLTDFGGGFTTVPGGGGITPSPTVAPTAPPGDGVAFVNPGNTDNTYNLRFEVTQLIYSGSIIPSIRGANFARDISYYQLRDTIDTVISTVRRQFYLVLLNAALIQVQEESVRLLENQVGDQQSRFEAGTVPRFNVLRAEVELSNQRPELIRARNNYRISQLELAKTLGLDFDPARGTGAPLRLIGELQYEPRVMPLEAAVAMGKERRTFLKERRTNIELQRANVGVAAGGWHPTIRASGGYEFQSSPFSSDINDVRSGYTIGATGTWAIWDSGQTYGRVKQARAVLEQARIAYEDAIRQVELEIQQAHSSVLQARELIASQEKNVEQAEESLRLAKARFDAGAGTQLEMLDARVALTQARSTKFQALFDYNAAVAEFDRVTGLDTVYVDPFIDPADLRRRGRLRLRTSTTTTTTVRPPPGTSGLSK